MTRPIEIVVLTQTDCPLCEHAKGVLARLRREFDLKIRTIEVNSDEGAQLAAGGEILFPPGIFVGGEAFSYGRVSERKLRRQLESQRAQESRTVSTP